MAQKALPKTAQKILSLQGISYLEKEVDQWVCYAAEGYWFPDLECQTCIDTNLTSVWQYVKTVEKAPQNFLDSRQ
jgi:hypothetical protein